MEIVRRITVSYVDGGCQAGGKFLVNIAEDLLSLGPLTFPFMILIPKVEMWFWKFEDENIIEKEMSHNDY